MCNPLLAAGVVTTAGSVLAKQQAAQQVQKARDAVIADQTALQSAYDAKASAVNDTSRERYADYSTKQSDKAQDLGSYFKKNSANVTSADANASAAASPNSSNLVVRETAKQLGKTNDYGTQQDEALGNLRSFGDVLGEVSRGQANDAAQVAQIGSFKRGMANILPYQLEDANRKGSGMRLFGDLLGAGGSALTMGGGAALGGGYSGFGSSWASLFGSEPYGAMDALGYIPTSSGGVDGLSSGFGIGGV